MTYLITISLVLLFLIILKIDSKLSIIKTSIYGVIFALLILIFNDSLYQHKDRVLLLLKNPEKQNIVDSLMSSNNKIQALDISKNVINEELIENYQNVILVGDGLTKEERKIFTKGPFQYFPNDIYGIININYSNSIYAGQKFKINLDINIPDSTGLLYLKGLGSILDSAHIKQRQKNYSLNPLIHSHGKYIFQLVVQNKTGEIIHQEDLALNINKAKKLNIALITESLSFEWKFLNRYLQKEAHNLIQRSNFGGKRYKWTYNNRSFKHQQFNDKLFDTTDLFLVDILAYNKLSRKSKKRFKDVKKDKAILFFLNGVKNQITIFDKKIKLEDLDHDPKKNINILKKIQVNKNLIFLEGNHLARIKGTNVYLLSPISSFKEILSGKTLEYSKFWQNIFHNIQLKLKEEIVFNKINYFHSPVKIYTRSESPFLSINGESKPLKKDLLESDLSYFEFFSNSVGWLDLNSNESKKSIFIYSESSWVQKKKSENDSETIRLVKNVNYSEEVPLISQKILFILLLLFILILWLYEKFR